PTSLNDINEINLLTEDTILMESEKNKVMLLSDTPGMGKTTILSSLSRKIKNKKPNRWVIRVDLNDYSKVLEEEKDRSFKKDDIENAINFLVDKLTVLTEDPFESRLLRAKMRHTGNVVVL